MTEYNVGDLVWIPDGTEIWKKCISWMEPDLPIKGPVYGLVLNSLNVSEYLNGPWLNVQTDLGSRVVHKKHVRKIEKKEKVYG